MPSFAVFPPAVAAAGAAAAVGVPLLVHLLFRKRYLIVPWAAIRFLVAAERRHRRRIDQWVLLALRVLALLLPLLAMIAATSWAEPLWQWIKPGATETVSNVPRTHHIVVLDASLSMTARTGNGPTRFEAAVTQARTLIRSGRPGDGYTLIVLSGTAQAVVPGPSNDPEKVVAELDRVNPTHAPAAAASALPAVADAVGRGKRSYPRRQVTFFTDLQRSAWATALPSPDAEPPEAARQVFRQPDTDVVVVDLARVDADNLAVADVALANPLPLVDTPVWVGASVANLGRAERKNVLVQLLVGKPGSDTLAAVEDQRIDVLPAGGVVSVAFGLTGRIKFTETGVHVLQIQLVPEGGTPVDDLPADDVRTVAVRARDGLHALLVDGKPNPDPDRRAAVYLSEALRPPKAPPSATPARPRIVTPAEFADPVAGSLDGVDCVYLCDVPVPGTDEAARDLAGKLDAFLRRGGSLVIGFGPTSAATLDRYNQYLFDDGNGVLPGPLREVVTVAGPDDLGFRLSADDEATRRAPLLVLEEAPRAGLVKAPFRAYVRMDAPPAGRARRILSIGPAKTPTDSSTTKPDPAVVEWSRHRGRVVVYTSSFNHDWNDWAVESYQPFQGELLVFAAAGADRHTLRVGDVLEEFFPSAAAGRTAGLTGPGGIAATATLVPGDDAAVARFPDTRLSGVYRVGLDAARDRVFAVNVQPVAPRAATESDLRRIDPAELKPLGPVQVVPDAADARPTAESGAVTVSAPKPHGPTIARYAVVLALLVFGAETFLAWRWGPARGAGSGPAGVARPVERSRGLRLASTALALLPLAAAGALLAAVVHYERTGNLLGFLPDGTRRWVESAAGVPAAHPGEGTRWRLEGHTAFVRNGQLDRRLVLGLAAACMGLTLATYRLERRAVGEGRRVFVPVLLRAAVFLLALFVLLPQLRIAFDREGWPEVVILIDTSASMGTAEELKDPAVRAKAEELVGRAGLTPTQRLELARLLLTRKDADWLDRLLREKEVRVHVYAVDKDLRPVASVEQAADLDAARAAIGGLIRDEAGNPRPLGNASRLGDGVEAVLKSFRGGSLAAVIMFTDGVTTAGPDLPRAAQEAARAGVPLYLVGVGDTWETPDLALTDLQAEDTVTVGDKLVFDVRLAARGQIPPGPVTVTLSERLPGQSQPVKRAEIAVTPDPSGNPVPVALAHTPTEGGQRTFVVEVAALPGEAETTNNRVERTVVATDSRRIRVLYIEGYPRYDFRFVKVLLERESERSLGGKGVEVEVILLGASKGWAETDRSAFRGEFPTPDQLSGYNVVILGDVDPKQLPRGTQALQDLAGFVRGGGGLLFLSGEHGTPAAYAGTPLADVLPVIVSDTPAGPREPEEALLTEGYRPRITPAGRQHPLFRFSPDDADSSAIWNRLQPLYWSARGYRTRPGAVAVVLARHPTRPAEGGPAGETHPLVVQSFAGAGPVLFLGFDDTWRWRYRNDEEYFDRFWVQAVRVLARAQSRRPEVRVSPKAEFRRDERVGMTVVVRFPVEAPAPAPGAPVRVTLTRGPLPNKDGSAGPGPVETSSLTLARAAGPGVQYEATLSRTPEGEYRFVLADPPSQADITPPSAVARVLPPPDERDRVELNKPDMAAAAALSNGGFYTLDTAHRVFDDLKNLQRVPLNRAADPVEVWNHPAVFLLILLLLSAEWLLRKRERLL